MEQLLVNSPQFFISAGLLSVRLGIVFLMTPLLGVFGLPVRFKVLLIAIMSSALIYGVPEWRSPVQAEAIGWLIPFLRELALGLALSLGVFSAFSAISVAGKILDTQMGYGIAQVFDPSTHRQLSIVSGTFNQFSVVLFFILDFHHILLRGLATSIEIYPLGTEWPISEFGMALIKQFGGLFALGFAFIAPIIFCILLVEFALSVLTRSLPQLHMLTLGIPLKIIVGLFALAIWLTGANELLKKVYNAIFESWKVMLQYG